MVKQNQTIFSLVLLAFFVFVACTSCTGIRTIAKHGYYWWVYPEPKLEKQMRTGAQLEQENLFTIGLAGVVSVVVTVWIVELRKRHRRDNDTLSQQYP